MQKRPKTRQTEGSKRVVVFLSLSRGFSGSLHLDSRGTSAITSNDRSRRKRTSAGRQFQISIAVTRWS